jgi:hypothetical protein
MFNKILLPLGVTLALAACQTSSQAPATVSAECRVFTDPGFVVRGATRKDQRWVSRTQETGVQVCGWKRPDRLPEDAQPVS